MLIVTGGAGFIGSALVWRLNAEGRDNILIVDHLGRSSKWRNLISLRYEDYMHKDHFLEWISSRGPSYKVSAIIHLGACSSTTEQDADYLMENNFHYSCRLCEWALQNSIRFIYASSAATYGNGEQGFSDADQVSGTLEPINMYGYSKQLFDLWVLRNGLQNRVVGLKFFNVFGPNEYHKGDMKSVVNKAFRQIRENGMVQLFRSHRVDYGDGEQKRDFVYIKDCVEILHWFISKPEVSGIFNVGTGAARSWNDLVNAVFSALELKPKIEYMDMPDSVRDQYQYFTEAETAKLRSVGCRHRWSELEDAVQDYVTGYLAKGEMCLR